MRTLSHFIGYHDQLSKGSISMIKMSLRQAAGQPGYIEGYVKQHEDGDFSTQFFDVYDSLGNEMENPHFIITDLMCHDFAPVMFDLANKYPDIINQDIRITF